MTKKLLILPSALLGALLIATPASAQPMVFNSTGSGQWVSVEPTAYDNRGYMGDPALNAVPSTFRGTRWDNTNRWTFNMYTNPGGEFIAHPGSWTTSSSDYDGIYAFGPGGAGIDDTVNIRNGHHITLDAPIPGAGYGEYGKVGLLNINSGGTLSILSTTVGAGTRVTNAGTLNISGTAHIHAEDEGFYNSGTTNIAGSSAVTANYVNNTGRININDSNNNILASTLFDNEASGIVSLVNSTATFGNAVNKGTIELTDSTLVGTGTGLQMKDGHTLKFTGDNEIQGTVSAENELNLIGTSADSRITMGPVNYTGASPTWTIGNTQTSLNATNLAGVNAVTANNEARIGGVGLNTVEFVFNNGSWLLPGNSIGVFNAKDIEFKAGSNLFIEADFGASTLDKILAANDLLFSGAGTVTVFVGTVAEDTGAEGASFTANFLEATSGNIKVGVDSANLDSAMVTDGGDNTWTVESGGTTILIKSATDGTNDVVDLTVVNATGKTLGLALAKTDAGATDDPSEPEPGPGPGPGPSKMSSNLETLKHVVLDEMLATQLHSAIVGTAGGDMPLQDALISLLDPVSLSLGSVHTEHSISNFNRTTYERIRFATANNSFGNYRGQSWCDPCEPVGCAPCDPCGTFSRSASRELWFQGQGGLIDQNDKDGIAGYYTNTYGYALGLDRKISRRTIVGFGFNNSFYDTKMNYGMGTANTKTYLFSLYGGHREGNWQLSGSFGYALSQLKSNRVHEPIGGFAQGKRDADSWFGAFELAHQFGSDRSYLTPFLAYDFVSYKEAGFTERGQLIDMTVGKRNVDAYVQTLGGRLGWRYVNRAGWMVNPVVTAGWVHDYGKGQTVTTAAFNEGGARMVLAGTSRNKDRALLGFGINADVNRSLTVFGRYDGEFADKFNVQQFQAGASVQF